MENTKRCLICNQVKPHTKFRCRGNYVDNKCRACIGKGERARLKLKMFTALGRKCNCCGETHPYLLTLDHINNDGHEFREQYNEQQIYRLAEREGWPKDRYQVLCMSCNFAKGHFGECPHKSGIDETQAMRELERKANLRIGYKHRNYEGMVAGHFKKGFDKRRPSQK